MSQLAYRVFTAKRPGINPDSPPGHESLMWVASATVIYSARDAVLGEPSRPRWQRRVTRPHGTPEEA